MISGIVLFIFVVPLWILATVIRYIVYRKNEKKVSYKRELILHILFFYILCFIDVTFFPLMVIPGAVGKYRASANLIPVLNTIKDIAASNRSDMRSFMIKFWIKNIFGNAALLAPMGMFLPILWEKFSSLRNTLFTCFLISLMVEILQFTSSFFGGYRIFDIDDIILNTIGALFGYILYKKVFKKINISDRLESNLL